MKDFLTEWNKFLKEDVDNKDVWVSPKQLESIFQIFHLSSQKLSEDDNFKFEPRTPRGPMVGEDDFTKRISLAPNINRAIYALKGSTKENQKWSGDKFYIYAGDLKTDPSDDIETVKLNIEIRRCDKDLSYTDEEENKITYSRSMSYKENPWRFYDYKKAYKLKRFGTEDCQTIQDWDSRLACKNLDMFVASPKSLYDEMFPGEKQKFYACVPDAKYTREEWSLNPITLYYVGTFIPFENKVWVSQKIIDSINSKPITKKIIPKT